MFPDTFEAELRTAMQVQADTLKRIERSAKEVGRSFADNRAVSIEIVELQRIMAELEAEADMLESEDLRDFDPGEIERIYSRHRSQVKSELNKVGYKDWNSFVLQNKTTAAVRGLDPFAPFDTLLTDEDYERLKNESSLRWDRLDYLFVFASGMLAALTDVLLVRIPKTMGPGEYTGQKGSPLTEWMKQYDTRRGHSEGWFADWARNLSDTCKTPYDRQEAVFDEGLTNIPGMGGHTHRFQSFGHDPVLGFVFGILDIMRATITGFTYNEDSGLHEIFSRPTGAAIFDPDLEQGFIVRLIDAFLKHIGHLISDVATPDGLPAPFMTLIQGINHGSFGEDRESIGEVARWMYLQGYDFRHFLVSGITPFVIEAVLRAYLMIRHYSEHGEVKFRLAQNPKYRSMLLTAHGVASAANVGKVALHRGNPLAINQAEWMAFMRYLLPHMKYWMFDRQQMKLEHMQKINDAGWNDLLSSSDQLLNRVVEKEWNVIDLGRYRNTQ